MGKPRRSFMPEFKQEAVGLCRRTGKSECQVARELGIPPINVESLDATSRGRAARAIPTVAAERAHLFSSFTPIHGGMGRSTSAALPISHPPTRARQDALFTQARAI